ncbi:MAG TPA: DUF4446 family protein [Bacillota bacterium]
MDIAAMGAWFAANGLLLSCFNVIIVLLVLLYFIIANARLRKYQMLLKTSSGKDLEQMLLDLVEKTDLVYAKLTDFETKFESNRIVEAKHLQKIGLIRFKAFQNSGGDQSFALAMLDAAGDGIVISSIFGRDEARVYCKPVEKGDSSYPMSEEEKEAIVKALDLKKK